MNWTARGLYACGIVLMGIAIHTLQAADSGDAKRLAAIAFVGFAGTVALLGGLLADWSERRARKP